MGGWVGYSLSNVRCSLSVLYLRERCCYLGYAYRIPWVFYPVSVSYVSRLPAYYLSGGAFLLIARRGLSDALRMRRLHRGAMCASYLVGILRIFRSPLIIFLIILGSARGSGRSPEMVNPGG